MQPTHRRIIIVALLFAALMLVYRYFSTPTKAPAPPKGIGAMYDSENGLPRMQLASLGPLDVIVTEWGYGRMPRGEPLSPPSQLDDEAQRDAEQDEQWGHSNPEFYFEQMHGHVKKARGKGRRHIPRYR